MSPTNLLGFFQSFATGCARVFGGEGNRGRRGPSPVNRVSHPASGRAELSRKAQDDYIGFFSPEQTARSPYRSSYLVAHPSPSVVGGPSPLRRSAAPSRPRDTRSPRSRVFTRVLEFCQHHTPPAKQIDPSSSCSSRPPFLHGRVHETGFRSVCTARRGISPRWAISERSQGREDERRTRPQLRVAAREWAAMGVRGPSGSQLRFRSHESAAYPGTGEGKGWLDLVVRRVSRGGGGASGNRGLPSFVRARTQRACAIAVTGARIYLYIGSGRMRARCKSRVRNFQIAPIVRWRTIILYPLPSRRTALPRETV